MYDRFRKNNNPIKDALENRGTQVTMTGMLRSLLPKSIPARIVVAIPFVLLTVFAALIYLAQRPFYTITPIGKTNEGHWGWVVEFEVHNRSRHELVVEGFDSNGNTNVQLYLYDEEGKLRSFDPNLEGCYVPQKLILFPGDTLKGTAFVYHKQMEAKITRARAMCYSADASINSYILTKVEQIDTAYTKIAKRRRPLHTVLQWLRKVFAIRGGPIEPFTFPELPTF